MATPVSHSVEHRRTHGGRALFALVSLLVLTGLSWGLAHLPLGAFDLAAAMAIAVVKASVVAFVFMELGTSGLVPRFIVLVTLLFILLMCGGIYADIGMR